MIDPQDRRAWRREFAELAGWQTRVVVVAGDTLAGLSIVAFTRVTQKRPGRVFALQAWDRWIPLVWCGGAAAVLRLSSIMTIDPSCVRPGPDNGHPTVPINPMLSAPPPTTTLWHASLFALLVAMAGAGCSSGPAIEQRATAMPGSGALLATSSRTQPAPSDAQQRTTPVSNAALASELDRLVSAATRQLVAQRLSFGTSDSGEPLQALSLSSTGSGQPRPVVLLVGQQRAHEHRSAEALLELSRQLTEGSASSVLDHIDVLVVPRLNPSGAVEGRIEYDHLLLETPEARSLAALMKSYDPAVVLDVHELPPGSADQYRVDPAPAAGTAAFIARAAREWFKLPAMPGSPTEETLAVARPSSSAGSLTAASGLLNAIPLSVAVRSLPANRSATQVLALLLKRSAQRANDLVKLRNYVKAEVAASACRGEIEVDGQRSLPRPCGYWIAAEAAPVVERLRALGVEVVPVDRQISVLGSLYPPATEGPHSPLLDALIDMPAGSYFVSLSQPGANVVPALLEPDSAQGYLRHGLVTDIAHIARLRAVPSIDGDSMPGSATTPATPATR